MVRISVDQENSILELIKQQCKMKQIILFTLIVAILGCSAPKKELDNDFYAFSNAGNLPNAPEDTEDMIDLLKNLGYEGWAGHYSVKDNPGRRDALEKAGLSLPEIYWRLDVDSLGNVTYKDGLKEAIADSKDQNLIVTYIIKAEAFEENHAEGDQIIVKAIQELADFAAPYGVRMAAYPHVNVYCETVEHSVRIAKMADRDNVGAAFNLPHFLKKEGDEGWQDKISNALPYLYMVSICGADSGDTQNMNMSKLIQPLGEGTYNPYPIVKFLKDNNYKEPIGLQCYNIKQDAEVALSKSISTWKTYQERYVEEK